MVIIKSSEYLPQGGGGGELGIGSVETKHLQDGAVTYEKTSTGVQDSLAKADNSIPKPIDWGNNGAKFLAGDGTLKYPPSGGGGGASNPYIEGTLTTNSNYNVIELDGGNLEEELLLDIGDVIKISGSANGDNDKYFTVEFIGDGDTDIGQGEVFKPAVGSIIVNYEHCGKRGNGSLKLANETATPNATIELFKKWHEAPLGLGQAWVVLKDVRSNKVNYTNGTGRSIAIASVFSKGGQERDYILVDGMYLSQGLQNEGTDVYRVIPRGSVYSLYITTTPTLQGHFYKELR